MQTEFESIRKTEIAEFETNKNLKYNVKGISLFKIYIGKILYRILIRINPIKKNTFHY